MVLILDNKATIHQQHHKQIQVNCLFQLPVNNFVDLQLINISGMWGWQNSNQSSDPGGPGTSGAVNHTAVPVVTSGQLQGQPQGQELTEMLTMLDQSGTTTFEDLNINMFSTPFE